MVNDKKTRNLQRKEKTIKIAERVLIVTEGEKTEPNYFEGIRRDCRLSAIIIKGNGKTEPNQIVERAQSLAGKYEKVYIVFDRDNHKTYDAAIKKISKLEVKNDEEEIVEFKAITSNPCFELWLLLHFELIQHPLKSKDALEKLKKYIPNYEKSNKDIFQKTKESLKTAYKNAGRLNRQENPCTNVGELVKFLRGHP